MLPAGIKTVVIEIILSAYVVRNDLIMVMVHRATLVFGIEILKQNVIQPWGIHKTDLNAQLYIFQGIQEITTFLLDIPFRAFTISIIVHEEHGRMVFKEMVSIEAKAPFICVKIKTCQPTA